MKWREKNKNKKCKWNNNKVELKKLNNNNTGDVWGSDWNSSVWSFLWYCQQYMLNILTITIIRTEVGCNSSKQVEGIKKLEGNYINTTNERKKRNKEKSW